MQQGVLIDDLQIKQLFKAALVEVIEEHADWFSQLFLEALEDIALGLAGGVANRNSKSRRSF